MDFIYLRVNSKIRIEVARPDLNRRRRDPSLASLEVGDFPKISDKKHHIVKCHCNAKMVETKNQDEKTKLTNNLDYWNKLVKPCPLSSREKKKRMRVYNDDKIAFDFGSSRLVHCLYNIGGKGRWCVVCVCVCVCVFFVVSHYLCLPLELY